jgi:hypothetical protein
MLGDIIADSRATSPGIRMLTDQGAKIGANRHLISVESGR